ncbi:hypothetical protein BJ165DRAFT_1524400 [Panaeolus papilionaceus]|nr:hypothetical protein BJ165DRAFT_1524400 [Panaeolus papilionaceus]
MGAPPAIPYHTQASLSAAGEHLRAGQYFQGAGYVMLIYDHLITMDQEVERVWKQKISGASILFFLNRYGNALALIVLIESFNDPSWPKEVCDRYVLFEGAQTIVLVAICELIMILRVFALYGRSISVLCFLMVLWCAQVVLSVIGIHTGWAVPFPPNVHGLGACILDGTSPLFLCLWVAPLTTDTCIFLLTVWRTRSYIFSRTRSTPIIQIFLRDGTIYFFIIFSANFLNFLIYVIAPPDLKAVGACFSQLITSVMVSRLVLNLRSVSTEKVDSHYLPSSALAAAQGRSYWDI